jgi:N-acetylglucosamine-6-phosphate deacetylase
MLRTGADADFVLIDDEWQVRATYVKGTKVYG